MSSCELEIVLERVGATFKVGDPVRGVIGVTVDATCRCRALTVCVEWYTHGSGNRVTGTATQAVLFEGEWKAGEKHLFPFDLAIGRGPLPYHGHHLNVDWRVVATAAIPWGFDPRAEAELVVLDDPDVPDLNHGPLADYPVIVQANAKILLAVMGAMFASIGGSIALVGPLVGLGLAVEEGLLTGLLTGAAISAVPLIFVAVGVWLVFKSLGPMLAARRLGNPTVVVSPTRLRGGDAVEVQVTMTPLKTTSVRGIYAVLSARERCVSGSGTNTRHYTHEVWSERIALGDPRTLMANLPTSFAGKARIPSDPAPSFRAGSNALEWAVEVHAELPRGPDWVAGKALTVRP